MMDAASALGEKVARGGRLWLFLDYDGTLAEFAPTPDTILPDAELIDLMSKLAEYQDVLRVVIMSGRRFSHIQTLLPVPGIMEAGTYGIEFKTWQGELVRLLDFDTARPFLDQLKIEWSRIIEGQTGFYLEDKGYSLAIHARLAEEGAAKTTLIEARRVAQQLVDPEIFRVLGGDWFIEVAPVIADKGQSVSMLLHRFAWPGADIVYFGDDDKDEEAFKVVQKNQGISILVAKEPRESVAEYCLESPGDVRAWLRALVDAIGQRMQMADDTRLNEKA